MIKLLEIKHLSSDHQDVQEHWYADTEAEVNNIPDDVPVSSTVEIPVDGTLKILMKKEDGQWHSITGSGGGEGGESTLIGRHGVIFIDYDGSIVTSWSRDSVEEKMSLPDNPDHDSLIAKGWNWSLDDIKDYISKHPRSDVYVGQMYETESGLTEIDILINAKTGATVECNVTGSKDWGDGNSDELTSHTYASYGKYTIKCNPSVISDPLGSSAPSCVEIRLGADVTSIDDDGLAHYGSLKYISLHDGITYVGDYSFANCDSLYCISIPNNVSTIAALFTTCSALRYVSIPNTITDIGYETFQACKSLSGITIPDGVSSLDSYVFDECSSIDVFVIPKSVVEISTQAFCENTCCNIVDFSESTSIPTIFSLYAFQNIPDVCMIIVPDSLYDSWISATGWSTFANYIVKASEVNA